jgi:hypothetical protein
VSRPRPVKVAFAKFWSPNITPHQVFGGMPYLFDEFDFVVSPDPDFLFFSVYPGDLPKARSVRIFYTAENVRPDMAACDWAFSIDYDEELQHPRHLRLPNYVRLGAGADLIKDAARAEAILAGKTRFCNFVFHNDVELRNRFFDTLSRYKTVDAPGRCRHNMPAIGGHADSTASRFAPGGYAREKIEFQRAYKFTIAFENAEAPGYTTEKIYHAMLADTLPLYWGNPLISRDFNPASFLDARAFASLDALAEAVVELDRDDDRYVQMMRAPWYPNNVPTRYVDRDAILDRFRAIFSSASP